MAKESKKPDELPPDKNRAPRGNGVVDKVEMYGWEMVDKPGKFTKLSKRLLHIDHDYQRDQIRWGRVNRIASCWSWARFGCLLVSKRNDGTFWVFDGQHRKLAADKRSDVDDLPCLVFECSDVAQEASLFIDQTDRGNLTMLDRFKALLSKNDQTAIQVREMVEASRYRIMAGNAKNTVRCVGVLMSAMKVDPQAARIAWRVVVAISDRESIGERVYQGLFAVERHLAKLNRGSLADSKMRPFVSRLSPVAINKSIIATTEFYGKGGGKVYGEGVLRLLNKGRQHRVPSLYSEADEDVLDADVDAEIG